MTRTSEDRSDRELELSRSGAAENWSAQGAELAGLRSTNAAELRTWQDESLSDCAPERTGTESRAVIAQKPSKYLNIARHVQRHGITHSVKQLNDQVINTD